MPEALTLDQMRVLVRKGLGGRDETDLPPDEVDQLLNISLWDVADRFWFKEKECIVSATTTAGVERLDIPDPLDAIHSISYIDPDTGESHKLHLMSQDKYEELRQEEIDGDTSQRGPPKRYTRWKDIIYLWPRPDKVYKLRLACWRTIKSLLEGTTETISLPRNWHELVIEGAIVRGHYYNEDYNLARQAENFRVGKERAAVLVKEKESRDHRYARLIPLDSFPEEANE